MSKTLGATGSLSRRESLALPSVLQASKLADDEHRKTARRIAKLDTWFAALPVAVIVADMLHGTVIFANESASALFEGVMLLGQDAYRLCIGAAQNRDDLLRAITKNDGLRNARTVIAIDGDAGKQKPVDLSVSSIQDEAGETVLVFTLIDRTAHEAELAAVAEQSMRDGLTGLPNRKACDERGQWEYTAMLRNGTVLSLILLDIDFFKAINDRYGHPGGDAVLREIAKTIKGALQRGTDFVGRCGGEEFVIFAPNKDSTPDIAEVQAQMTAEKIRRAVEAMKVRFGNVTIPVTVSLGIATHRKQDRQSFGELYAQADRRLYASKGNGRNRTTGEFDSQELRQDMNRRLAEAAADPAK